MADEKKRQQCTAVAFLVLSQQDTALMLPQIRKEARLYTAEDCRYKTEDCLYNSEGRLLKVEERLYKPEAECLKGRGSPLQSRG